MAENQDVSTDVRRPRGKKGIDKPALQGADGDVMVFGDVAALETAHSPHMNKVGTRVHFVGGGSIVVAETVPQVADILELT